MAFHFVIRDVEVRSRNDDDDDDDREVRANRPDINNECGT